MESIRISSSSGLAAKANKMARTSSIPFWGFHQLASWFVRERKEMMTLPGSVSMMTLLRDILTEIVFWSVDVDV